MFQRFFSARQTPLPERQELSSGHTCILEDCITTIRTDIFQLERRIKLINADILTVCHCIKNKQPSFVPPNSVRLPEISQTEAVSSPFKGSPKNPPNEAKGLNRPSQIERPADVPEGEREIPSPTSIDCEDMILMAAGKAELQVQLNLVVLKKAVLEVEVGKLESDLLFWAGIYHDVKIAHREESDKEEKRKPSFQTKKPSRPSLLREPSFDSDPISSNHVESRSIPTSAPFIISRKEVPFKEMTARVKATSLFSSTLSRSHKTSWSQVDDLFMTEGSGSRARGTGSTKKFGTENHAKHDHTRDDSGADLSADIQRRRSWGVGITELSHD
ncbi:hypothetical protein F5882DRAFT_465696 [Hyaloscypha sp. PMI_1271]|nr:hypothetical protein F5882DRAFT_465696 [Hyaloscypha sp. PMI_1271]